MEQIRIGTILYGYCGGFLGDVYEDKRVEFIAVDWLVARGIDSGEPYFFYGDARILEEYTVSENKH